jgi:hypothetical protein
MLHQGNTIPSSKTLFAVGPIMDMNERQIALSLLESLREDLIYAHLNNGSRILDVADLRQYIYEQMGQIRTNALVTDGLYGKRRWPRARPRQSNGRNGKAHP